MNFKKPALEDKEQIQHYLKQVKLYGCEFTFANFYLWSSYYKTEFAIVEDALLFRSGLDEQNRAGVSFSRPVTGGDIRPALEWVLAYCDAEKIPFSMYNITPDLQEQIERQFPDAFEFTPDRDSFDYIYRSSDLINLTGKKYHGKRNHINNFKLSDWAYETITVDNMDECLAMYALWCEDNDVQESESKQAEGDVIRRAFAHFQELDLRGGLLRQNGRVVAFTIGEELNEETFVVHIEKAFADVQGAYPMINREFAAHEAAGYTYINREEDLGLEGLRKAKLSYRPAFLLEKSTMTRKQ